MKTAYKWLHKNSMEWVSISKNCLYFKNYFNMKINKIDVAVEMPLDLYLKLLLHSSDVQKQYSSESSTMPIFSPFLQSPSFVLEGNV